MPPKLTIAYKNMGQTPLECLNEWRIKHPNWANLPMTYAGRLDPMAEGLMIILIGDECKNKDQYLKFDKTYEFQILVGFGTDTYDLLGIVASPEVVFERSSDLLSSTHGQTISNTTSGFNDVLQSFLGTFTQKYPAFSSKTVDGKQLFQLSRDNELPIELPEHEVTINKLELLNEEVIKKEDLEREIKHRISLVQGDFRQKDILDGWQKALDWSEYKEYKILSLVCDCSSGTYIRQLVSDIGVKLGIPMVTYSIKRTRVGEYNLHDIVNI